MSPLQLRPTQVTRADTVRLVTSILLALDDDPALWISPDRAEDAAQSVFIARTPDDALIWLCSAVDKRDLLQRVNDAYMAGEEPVSTVPEPDVAEASANSHGTTGPARTGRARTGRARKCPATNQTRRANKRIRDRMLTNIANVWGDQAASHVALDNNHLSLIAFFRTYPDISESRAWDMISTTAAITAGAILGDWATLLKLWRRHARNRLNVLGPSAQSACRTSQWLVATAETLTDRIPDSQPLTIQSSGEGLDEVDEVVDLTQRQKTHEERFRSLYLALDKAETTEVAQAFLFRWIVKEMFEESQILGASIYADGGHTGQQGVGVSTLARQRQLDLIYHLATPQKPMSKERFPQLWNKLDRRLTYGKKWQALASVYGNGILGFIPPSEVPNTFIQRTLSIDQVPIWGLYLKRAIPTIQEICDQIEPLYMAYVQERAPPVARLLLEVEDPQDITDVSLLELPVYLE